MVQINVSDVISGIALLMSGYATWKTLQLNKSQEKLNQLLTAKEEVELSNEKKADVSANIVKLGNGKQRLKVFNKGKCVARNVKISFPNDSEVPVVDSDLKEKFPISLEPHQSVEVIVFAHMGMKRRFSVQIDWADNSSEENKKVLELTL